MTAGRDWLAWHADYDVPDSPLAQRLAVVQGWIRQTLDQAPPGPVRVVSMCAGQGRDLIDVLSGHPRGTEVTARLVEIDPRIAAAARQRAAAAGLPLVDVVTGDAGLAGAYTGLAPADLVLACGVFGNISAPDIQRTIASCARLCAPGGTVIWTKSRQAPDLIPQICQWFAEQDFELAGVSDPGPVWAVGAHRFTGRPAPLLAGERMFTFRYRPDNR
jgi:SAM-dependent methyltransferase